MTLYMPLFRSCRTSKAISQLHSHLSVTGLHRDPLASTKLIESYAQTGNLQSARLVFQNFPEPDSFMYGVLIKCYVWNGFLGEAISLYNSMVYHQIPITGFIFPSVLRACSGIGDLGLGQKVHGRLVRCGFEFDSFVEASLLSMYGESGSLDDARKVFDAMSVRDVVSWSSIIASYVQNGRAIEGMEIFSEMVIVGGQEPDFVSMLSVAEACAELGFLKQAKSVHGYVIRKEIESNGSLGNSLIAMYGRCGNICSAEVLFDNLIHKGTSSWTALITCYNQNGCYREALHSFLVMQEFNVQPNAVTMMAVLSCCARIGWITEGKSIHCYVLRNYLDIDYELLRPSLIDMYANGGNVKYGQKLFDATHEKDIVLWNMLISGHAREGFSHEALMLFVQMLSGGILPDSFTLASVLSACGDFCLFHFGSQIHGYIIKTSIYNEFVQNSLIDMYSKSGFVDSAFMIFDKDKRKGVVTWNSMISGFSRNGNYLRAVSMFDEMYTDCLEIDEVTFLVIIQACANLGFLEKGKWVHHKLITSGIRRDVCIDTALVDMYAKCGELQTAQRIFDGMSDPNVVSWSTIIAGYGMHGEIDSANALFKKMTELGVKPNEVTFMNILSACSHAGYVNEGRSIFSSMTRDFGIEPTSEHYSCIIDLLSRAGDLDEAYRIINSMPFPADASIWGALLNGCRIHGRVDMIKGNLKRLLTIETDDTGYYTLLSNIFAERGDWDEFGMVRSMMRDTGLRKVNGCSTVETDSTK